MMIILTPPPSHALFSLITPILPWHPYFSPWHPLSLLGAYPSRSLHATSFVHSLYEDYSHRNNNNQDIVVGEGGGGNNDKGGNNDGSNGSGMSKKDGADSGPPAFNHKYLYEPQSHRQLFSIQGNFGGRYAPRSDLSLTVLLLYL